MLSKYFKMKTNTEKFDKDLKWSLGEIKDKKIIIYGAGEGFVQLNKKYHFDELNIVAIADKKFEKETTFKGLKAINPEKITNQNYDVILIANESPDGIVKYLKNVLNITDKDIRTVFNSDIKDEAISYNTLQKFNFEKHLKKLNKKLKNKKVVLYGAGMFLEAINKYYDLSGLNIIAVSDKRFEDYEENEEFLGYKACAPDEIKDLNPDYVLVATRFFINIIEYLYYDLLKNTKIKIKPLMHKPFFTLLKEIWK